MKNLFKILTVLFLLAFNTVFGATRYWVGGASANWSSTSSWSTSLGGAGGSSVPTSSDAVIFDGSDISSTAGLQTGAVTASLTTANRAAGTLTVQNSGDFTIIDGSGTRILTVGNLSGTDLDIKSGCFLRIGASSNACLTLSAASVVASISGTLDVSGSSSTVDLASASVTVNNGGVFKNIGTLSNTSGLAISSGGTFEDAKNPATIPTATWDINGNLKISGYTNSTTAPTGLAQLFGNVEWNCASQTGNAPLNAAVEMRGNFTITSTGSGSIQFVTGTAARNMIIRGNFKLTAGTFNLSSSATSTHNGTINLKGDFTMNGGTLTESGSATACGITLDSTITQTFTKTAGTISNLINFTVASGAIVDFQNILDGSTGAFTNSGTMKIKDVNGILTSTASGQIQMTGTRTYNTTANYHYTGSSSQVFGTGLPSTVNDLLINNGNPSMSLNGGQTVSGALTITSGKVNVGANTLTLNGSFSGSSSNCIKGSASSNITVGGTGSLGTLYFDQTTGGTTNKIATFTVNRSGQTILIGNDLQIGTSLTLTAGKFGINGQTLTLNSANITNDASNCLVGSNTSNLSITGSGSLNTLYFEQSSASDTSLNNLTINRSGQTITLGNTLKIEGALIPTAGTLATGGNLILESNATNTARIADGGCSTCSYITGNVKVRRYIPSVGRRWRFVSSNISNGTLDDWHNEIYITGTGGASNGFDPTLSNQGSIYYYDESIITGDLNNGWTSPSSTSNSLTVGRGYRMFIRGDRSDPGRLDGTNATQNAVTLDLVGTVNTGDVNLNPTYTSSGDSSNDGWNLLGNPYPSQIDWNAFHDAGRTNPIGNKYVGTDYTCILPTAYIFDASTNSYVAYNALTNAGTGSFSNGIIPSGASFFVHATPEASPALTMKETYKSSTSGAAVFKTSGDAKHFRMKMIQDSITSDEMVIVVNENAKYKRDQYDIPKMWGQDVNISTISTDTNYLALNCLPLKGIADTIPVSCYVKKTGTFLFTVSNVNSLAPGNYQYVYLFDDFTGSKVDLKLNAAYQFDADYNNLGSYGDHRFYLVIGSTGPVPPDTSHTAVKEVVVANEKAKVVLYPTIVGNEVFIKTNIKSTDYYTIQIIDISGKQLYQETLANTNDNPIKINTSSLLSGMYYVRFTNSKGNIQTTLKFIKQ